MVLVQKHRHLLVVGQVSDVDWRHFQAPQLTCNICSLWLNEAFATAIGEVIMINEVCQVLFCSPNIG